MVVVKMDVHIFGISVVLANLYYMLFPLHENYSRIMEINQSVSPVLEKICSCFFYWFLFWICFWLSFSCCLLACIANTQKNSCFVNL